jgi:hypothetical protein
MLTNVRQYGVQLDLESTTPPTVSWAGPSRVIYYPHYALTGDRTHALQAFINVRVVMLGQCRLVLN